jgi:hypothetical protein
MDRSHVSSSLFMCQCFATYCERWGVRSNAQLSLTEAQMLMNTLDYVGRLVFSGERGGSIFPLTPGAPDVRRIPR